MAETPEQVEAADPDDESGRRVDPDEIDPELISLSAPRRRVGPLLSLSIIVFCALLIHRLYADFRFSRQSDSAQRVADPKKIVDRDGIVEDDFVSVRAMPDHSYVVRITAGEADYGHRVAPVLGTDQRLWVMVPATPWAADPAYTHIYSGRVRALANLPFYDELRDYVAAQPGAERFVSPAEVEVALAGDRAAVVDPFNDSIEVANATPVVISETVLDRARIQAFKFDSFPDRASWRGALIAAELITAAATAAIDNNEFVEYEVSAPAGVEPIRQRVADSKLHRIRIKPVVRPHETTWGELSTTAEGLQIGAASRLPWPNITSVSLVVPRRLRSDAVLLMTDERPGTYWYILPVYLVLAGFILLFAWALFRALRRPSRPPDAA